MDLIFKQIYTAALTQFENPPGSNEFNGELATFGALACASNNATKGNRSNVNLVFKSLALHGLLFIIEA